MLEGVNATESQYAIFDGMEKGLKNIPNFKSWLVGEKVFVIEDKYMRKQRITWGKPSMRFGPSFLPEPSVDGLGQATSNR